MTAYIIYGMLIYFRIEMRQGVYPTLIFRLGNYRCDDRILNRDYPVRVSKQARDKDMHTQIASTLPKYLRKIRDAMRSAGRSLTAEFPIPLALQWQIDADTVFTVLQITAGQRNEYKRAMEVMIQHWGDRPLFSITPGQCYSVLAALSEHMRSNCIRIMGYLTACDVEFGNPIPNPWVGYKLGSVQDHKISQINQYIDDTMLASDDIAKLMEYCIAAIRQTHDIRYFTLLLRELLGLPTNLICALDHTDILPLQNLSRYCLHIYRTYREAGKRCRLCPLPHDYNERMIPLPTILVDMYMLLQKPSGPLVGHPDNAARRCPPETLDKWYADVWDSIYGGRIDWKGNARRIRTTVERCLQMNGYSVDEINYHFGIKPQGVTAKHYIDFGSEIELAQLGAMLDNWLDNIFREAPASPTYSRAALTKKGAELEVYPHIGSRANTEIRIALAESDVQSDDTIQLALSCLGGMDFRVEFILYDGEQNSV